MLFSHFFHNRVTRAGAARRPGNAAGPEKRPPAFHRKNNPAVMPCMNIASELVRNRVEPGRLLSASSQGLSATTEIRVPSWLIYGSRTLFIITNMAGLKPLPKIPKNSASSGRGRRSCLPVLSSKSKKNSSDFSKKILTVQVGTARRAVRAASNGPKVRPPDTSARRPYLSSLKNPNQRPGRRNPERPGLCGGPVP